ncbi:MAG: chorismate synthase [Desulfurococcales archaeon]|nr:chorismate synthase [Desulfurococcales archaeon]
MGLGRIFRVTIFGESHGKGVGAVIEGVPPGIPLEDEYIQGELARRRPGGRLASPRREEDRVEVLSGVFRGYTTGAPIALFIRNRDVDSSFYERIRYTPRPGHADYPAWERYLGYQDYRGGGIFSGRRTAALVAAGAVARRLLEHSWGVVIAGLVREIGGVECRAEITPTPEFVERVYSSPVRCPDPESEKAMVEVVEAARREGDSVGSLVEVTAFNVPPGLGDPPLDGLDSDLAKAVMSIPAAKGFEVGEGFRVARMKGSEVIDPLTIGEDGRPRFESNRHGGILGGLSTGSPIIVRAAFKPPTTIRKQLKTVDLKSKVETTIVGGGRHDPVIGPRALPVVEAVVAIVIADHALRLQASRVPGVKDLRPWRGR